jgi:xanthine dehydrogenase accessory factor
MTLAPLPSIFAALADNLAQGKAAVLAVVVAAQGSTPQKAGAKMVLQADGATLGTVGGGHLEAQVLQAAQEVLRAGTPRLLEVDLASGDPRQCGGRVTVYLEPVLPPPVLYIVGAGHVGQALAGLAAGIGFAVTLWDDRPISLPPELRQVRCQQLAAYGDPLPVPGAGDDLYIVIASRSHQFDEAALTAALRTPARYIGLLASSRKKQTLAQNLLAQGFSPADLERVYAPVGLDVGAVGPTEIAVSIAAQLIAIRRNHATAHLSPAFSRRLLQPDGSAQGPAAPER